MSVFAGPTDTEITAEIRQLRQIIDLLVERAGGSVHLTERELDLLARDPTPRAEVSRQEYPHGVSIRVLA